jgi:hypothetical protein
MSYVIAAPEMMTSAATDLATIGSDLTAAHTAAATSTVALVPAAADEVSASIAHVFSQHAAGYQALAGKAAAFHEQFVQTLKTSAGSYAGAEAAAAASLRPAAGTNPLVEILNLIASGQGLVLLNAIFASIGPELQVIAQKIAATTPEQWLEGALLLLFWPITVPLYLLYAYYALTHVMLPSGLF